MIVAQAIAFADNGIPRQVDPSKVQEQSPNPSSLIQFYQGIFRLVSLGNFSSALSQLNSTGIIHVPSQIQFIYTRFNSLLSNAASQLQQVNSSINQATFLLQKGNPEQANSTVYQAYYQLSQANVTITQLQQAAPQMESSFGIPSGQLQNQVSQLELLAANYKSVLDALSSRISNLIIALQTDRAFSTKISLNSSETQVYLGNNITLYGKLATSRNIPLSNKTVQILSSSLGIKQYTKTDSKGYFQLSIQIPYIYENNTIFTASFIPSIDDANVYLASFANISIRLLYYKPAISLEVSGSGLPGSTLHVNGSYSLTNYTSMQIDLTAFGLKQTLHADKGFFSTLLHIPLNIQDGDYTILASSNAYGLIAPASATSQIAVRRLDANVTFASSSLVFGGQTLEISGIAFASNGTPLSGSLITAVFANVESQSVVKSDGSFVIHLSIPLFSPSGKVKISLLPAQPWVEQFNASKNITAISPLAVISPIVILLVLIIMHLRRAAPLKRIEEHLPQYETKKKEGEISEVLASYLLILNKLAQKGLRIKSSETLREYLQRVTKAYPDFAEDFSSITRIVEDEIYGFGASEDDKHLANLLAGKLISMIEK